ncbi:hypothetical protein LWI28_003418 [Acer negundo]|uniref:Uncharacterized protein n=1 Tax=Acer negundo TaxID=4023 RepID=A0AAD5NR93_ACENE|nr:hypothetical protein LWI28_003418 [Acer negundo]
MCLSLFKSIALGRDSGNHWNGTVLRNVVQFHSVLSNVNYWTNRYGTAMPTVIGTGNPIDSRYLESFGGLMCYGLFLIANYNVRKRQWGGNDLQIDLDKLLGQNQQIPNQQIRGDFVLGPPLDRAIVGHTPLVDHFSAHFDACVDAMDIRVRGQPHDGVGEPQDGYGTDVLIGNDTGVVDSDAN